MSKVSRSCPNSRETSPLPADGTPIAYGSITDRMKRIIFLCDTVIKKTKSADVGNALTEIRKIAESERGKCCKCQGSDELKLRDDDHIMEIKKMVESSGRQINQLSMKLDKIGKDMSEGTEILCGKLDECRDLKGANAGYDSGGRKSYANAVKTISSSQTLVIKSSCEEKTSSDIEGSIKRKVNLKSLGIGIDGLKRSKVNKSVLIRVERVEHAEKLKEAINSITELEARDAEKRNPLVVFKGLLKGITEEDFNESLKMQNKHLDISESIKFKYKRKNRHSLLINIVCQVSVNTWRKLTEVGKVHVGFTRVTVENESPLVQCFKCLKFGHTQTHCNQDEWNCAKCGEKHDTRDCRATNNTPKCLNCAERGRDDHQHMALSYLCQVRKFYERLAIDSTNYRS
jgi:hypothetical protein